MSRVLKSYFENKLKCLKIALKYTHTHTKSSNSWCSENGGSSIINSENENNINLQRPVAQAAKNPPAMQETQVQYMGWENPLERELQPTPVFLPGESHGLAGYSRKESDTPEQLTPSFLSRTSFCECDLCSHIGTLSSEGPPHSGSCSPVTLTFLTLWTSGPMFPFHTGPCKSHSRSVPKQEVSYETCALSFETKKSIEPAFHFRLFHFHL